MEKKEAGKLGIRIWGWPTLFFFVSELILFLGFKLTAPDASGDIIESGSGREALFEIILGCLIIIYLWILVYRHSKIGDKKLPVITKSGVIFLTILFVIGMICQLFLYFRNNQ